MLKEFIVHELESIAEKIRKNECELSDLLLKDISKYISHTPLSKVEAYRFLHISRSKFDYMIHNNQIPEGKKRSGWKELCWYKDELELCAEKYNLKYESNK